MEKKLVQRWKRNAEGTQERINRQTKFLHKQMAQKISVQAKNAPPSIPYLLTFSAIYNLAGW